MQRASPTAGRALNMFLDVRGATSYVMPWPLKPAVTERTSGQGCGEILFLRTRDDHGGGAIGADPCRSHRLATLPSIHSKCEQGQVWSSTPTVVHRRPPSSTRRLNMMPHEQHHPRLASDTIWASNALLFLNISSFVKTNYP